MYERLLHASVMKSKHVMLKETNAFLHFTSCKGVLTFQKRPPLKKDQ